MSQRRDTLHVIVLGDIGHSPRMLRHAQDLCKQSKVNINLVSYFGMSFYELPFKIGKESELPSKLNSQNVTMHCLCTCSAFKRVIPNTLFIYVKGIILTIQLFLYFAVLLRNGNKILVQVPSVIAAMLTI